MVLQEIFKGCFKKDLRVFQWSFKLVSRMLKRSSNGCLRKVSKVFHGSFMCVSRKIEGCS